MLSMSNGGHFGAACASGNSNSGAQKRSDGNIFASKLRNMHCQTAGRKQAVEL